MEDPGTAAGSDGEAVGSGVSLPLLPRHTDGVGQQREDGGGGGGRGGGQLLSSVLRLRRRRRGRSPAAAVGQTNPNSAAAAAEEANSSNAKRLRGQQRPGAGHSGSKQRSKVLGDEANRKMRLKRLKALLKGSDIANQVVNRATGAAGVGVGGSGSIWHGVFTSLSPTDTGGVLSSLTCLALLACCVIACAETCQRGLHESAYEFLIWMVAQTLACIILIYVAFLAAIAVLARRQWRLAEARKARRVHVRLQRELMKRLREGIRRHSEDSESTEFGERAPTLQPQPPPPQQQQQQPPQQQLLAQESQQQQQEQKAQQQPLQQQQQQPQRRRRDLSQKPPLGGNSHNSTAAGCHGNTSSGHNADEPAEEQRRRDRRELVEMMQELERLISVELSLLGVETSDLDLLDQALGPKPIGSAWLSNNCHVSLYKAPGRTATAFARVQRF